MQTLSGAAMVEEEAEEEEDCGGGGAQLPSPASSTRDTHTHTPLLHRKKKTPRGRLFVSPADDVTDRVSPLPEHT